MDKSLIKEALSDEAFVKKLSELKSVEEVQIALREKNLEFSIEELTKLSEQFISSGELSSDQLEDVAGGLVTPFIVAAYGIVVAGVLQKLLFGK